MSDGNIRLYDTEKNLLHTLKTGDPIAVVRFGPYAREDGALAVVSTSGSVDYRTILALSRKGGGG